MRNQKQLELIQGGSNPGDYSNENVIESLKGSNDEFTIYRVEKEINKTKAKLINELNYNNQIGNTEGEQYLKYIIENYSKLSLDSKAHLYGFTRGLLMGERKL